MRLSEIALKLSNAEKETLEVKNEKMAMLLEQRALEEQIREKARDMADLQ